MLWQASEGRPENIPGHYLTHLEHTYSDGSISLAGLLNKIDYSESLEDYELEEVIEMLGKVQPGDWPDPADILSIDAPSMLRIYDANEEGGHSDFVETEAPSTTSEKAEKVLRHAIESVFGDKVQKVRSAKGDFPDEDNGYLQEANGAFKGKFEFGGKVFDFTLEPDESGWTLQYRMQASSLDSLPPIPPDAIEGENVEKRLHHRGWN
jgi:hypothetical protein